MTPRLTEHARQRCVELGITTKRAKRIVQEQVSTYPAATGHDNNGVMVMSDDPDYAVVWDPATNDILTVLPRVQQDYVRTSSDRGGFELISFDTETEKP